MKTSLLLLLALVAFAAAACTSNVDNACTCSGTDNVIEDDSLDCSTSLTISADASVRIAFDMTTSLFIIARGAEVTIQQYTTVEATTTEFAFDSTIYNEGTIAAVTFSTQSLATGKLRIYGGGTLTIATAAFQCIAGSAIEITNAVVMQAGTIAAPMASTSINITGTFSSEVGATLSATNGGAIYLRTGGCDTALVSLDSLSSVVFGENFVVGALCVPTVGTVEIGGVLDDLPTEVQGNLKFNAGATATVTSTVTGVLELEFEANARINFEAGGSIQTSGHVNFGGDCTVSGVDAELKVIGYTSYSGTFEEVRVNGDIVTAVEVSGRRLLAGSAEYRDDGFYASGSSSSDDSAAAALAAPLALVAAAAAALLA